MPKRAVLILSVLAAASASAQPFGPSGAEFRVNSDTTGSQVSPAVGVDLFGRFFVVWLSPDGDGNGVSARRFSHTGAPIDPTDFRVNAATTGDHTQAWVTVAPDLTFDAIVSYERDEVTGNDIHARRYDESGALAGPFQPNGVTSMSSLSPRVAADGSGNWVAVWNDGGTITGQRFDAAGAALGGTFTVAVSSTADAPRVARAPGGEFVVVWNPAASDLEARRYSAAGAALGAAMKVSQATNIVRRPAVAMSDAHFVVTWDVDTAVGQDVRARVIGADGAAETNEFGVNTYTTGDQLGPEVGVATGGGFVIVWSDRADRDGGGAAGASVWAKRYDASNAALGAGEFRVNSYTTGNQLTPRIGMQANGDFVVVWFGTGQGPLDGDEVYAQRFCHALAGDANASGAIDVSDVFYIVNHLFAGGAAPLRNSDANGDGVTDVLDVFYLINFLFAQGPGPSCPLPLI